MRRHLMLLAGLAAIGGAYDVPEPRRRRRLNMPPIVGPVPLESVVVRATAGCCIHAGWWGAGEYVATTAPTYQPDLVLTLGGT